ncbi:hypothetical protein CDL12_12571 [Handroanthus impetiginosus]|uniref:O-acyltransferase WSD1 C-terminal domain-containing protein n=1 Tax=Handroanthus impetiginosus TaxID=429701 RepID=A0A2G9HB81_9LAMI|nr:hypothetical protein CDL12_12571 [Handroanthus impetiginosus]
MDVKEGEVLPMSPSSQYLKSSALSLTILAVLELQFPFDDSMFMSLLKEVFLPINPRFSSIMVTERKGVKKWKKVEVNLKDHVYTPIFPSNMSIEYYDECFTEYLSKVSMEQLPQNRPFWEIHILKYPTKNAASNLIFKPHHSLGDGYSLMGALLSCVQRIDNPLMPLTFPSRQSCARPNDNFPLFRWVPRFFTGVVHTAYDFGSSLFKSTLVKDDKSPVRSGGQGVEFRPIVTITTTFCIDQIKQIKTSLKVSTLVKDDKSPVRSGGQGVEFRPIVTITTTFCIDQIKQIKTSLKVTINDVITGVIIFGTRLYMQKTREGSERARSTALVLLNTRAVQGYKSVDEMVKPGSKMPWGNRFAFLQVSMPRMTDEEQQNPLIFVKKPRRMIKRQRNSAAVYLTGQFLNLIRKIRGPEATARYIHGTLKNTSMAISNMMGPVEQMALANQPVKGLYFVVAGPPQSLSVTMISYVGKLRIAVTVEKGFIDQNKLKSCIEYAFEVIYKAALESAPPTKS